MTWNETHATQIIFFIFMIMSSAVLLWKGWENVSSTPYLLPCILHHAVNSVLGCISWCISYMMKMGKKLILVRILISFLIHEIVSMVLMSKPLIRCKLFIMMSVLLTKLPGHTTNFACYDAVSSMSNEIMDFSTSPFLKSETCEKNVPWWVCTRYGRVLWQILWKKFVRKIHKTARYGCTSTR